MTTATWDFDQEAETPAPFRVVRPERRTSIRFWAIGAGMFALVPEIVYNVAPSMSAAFQGDGSAAALMVVRIGAVIALSIVPRTREYRLTVIGLVLFGLWSAYVSGQTRHASETAGANEKITLEKQYTAKLNELRLKLEGWKAVTAVSAATAAADTQAYNDTVRASQTCSKYRCLGTMGAVASARNKMQTTLAQRKATEDHEALVSEISDYEKKLAGLGFVPKHASIIDAQIAARLNITEEHAADLQAALIALFIEMLNRTLPRIAHNGVLKLYQQKTSEEEEAERDAAANDAALEREYLRRVRESELVGREAQFRTEQEIAVKAARAELDRQEADTKARADLDEKRRQAAMLAEPITSLKEAKEREKLEAANEKLKRQQENAARRKRDLKDKEAKKRSDAAVWVARFIDEGCSPLPYGVDPMKARIKTADFRKTCNSWVKSKGGVVEEDATKFGTILSEVGPEFSYRKSNRTYVVGLDLTPKPTSSSNGFTLHSVL